MRRTLLVILLWVLATTAVLAAPVAAQDGAAAGTSVGAGSSEYQIGPEDVLDISVWNQKELDRVVPVRPDGKISFPLVHDIHAAGLTPMQLRDALTKALSEFIAAPSVSVVVSEIHSFKVSVIGEVKKPGRYELKSRATVLDAIAMAEGFTEYASRNNIVILRHENSAVRRITFSYSDAVNNRNARGGMLLMPDDVIVVP